MAPREKYEVFIRIAGDDDDHLYLVEHWFPDLPERAETVRLLADARETFAVLYPEAEAVDFSVEVRRLRPEDDHRPFPPPAEG